MTTPMSATPTSFRFDFSNILPEAHEKALKQAIFNVAAFLFVLFIFCACVAVYYVLEPFLRPLLWAVLFGSVLHPFKHSLSVVLRRWLRTLHDTGTPLAIGGAVAPFRVIDNISNQFLDFIIKYGYVVAGFVGITSGAFVICRCVPDVVWSAIWRTVPFILNCISAILEFCHGATFFVWTVVIGYIIVLTFWWTPHSRKYLIHFSPFVWSIFICHLVSIAGSLRLTILLMLFALMVVGLVAEMRGHRRSLDEYSVDTTDGVTPLEALRSWFSGPQDSTDSEILIKEEEDESDANISELDRSQNVQVDPSTPEKPKFRKKKKQHDDEKMSNYFMYGLLWSCVFAQVWLHMWLLNLFLIPSVYIGVKLFTVKFGVIDFLKARIKCVWEKWKGTLEDRRDAIIPTPIRGLWRLLVVGDQKVLTLLEGSVDSFTSIVAILSILIFAVLGAIFISLQIYGESMHLVTVTSGLINKTIHDTEIQTLIPEGFKDVQGALDSMLGDAYLYARGWLTTTIRRMIDDKDSVRAAVLEKQILDVFDRVYNLWITRDSNNPADVNTQHGASMDSLFDGLKTLNVDLIISFLKENIGTLMSVIDSLWGILKGNISLAFSAVTAILSIVFGGGTAVLNFFLNFIIFTTSLFYLLCASGDQYKPVELFNSLLPSSGAGTKFGLAVEEAINGVFAASFKMAAFYGLYTWLIHTLFDVKIVYIPSVLAAVFGAVPFLGAYWACLPAVLELWLVYGQIWKAAFMLACQIIPMSFVDTAIYSEITGGGHPYLTGLAIAGGVFCLGFEGALFGPMLLCVLFVAMHMYGAFIQPSYLDGTVSRRASRPFSLKRMFTIQ